MSALSSLLLIVSTPSWTMTGEHKVKRVDHSLLHLCSCIRRIVVLDNGRVVEYDPPNTLIADRKSAFFSMAKNAGLVA